MSLFDTILNDYHQIKDASINFLSNKYQIVYIIESANWSIRWDGKQIIDTLNISNNFRTAVRITARGIRNRIIHFGSWGTYLASGRFANVHPSNQLVLTIFHVANQIKPIDVQNIVRRVYKVHTSCLITRQALIDLGVPRDKIVVIPIGVDTRLFKPADPEDKIALKKRFGLPLDKPIIGSFQKDGVGWKEGLEPKLIKGPDIFLRVIEQLHQRRPIHVLLTGPARGYVKRGLEKIGVPYTHRYLKHYPDIVPYYQVLDLYLVTSRNEGGPKSILEAGATGIPVVTTAVGMAPEIIRNGENGFLSNIDDIDSLVTQCQTLLIQTDLRNKLIKELSDDVQAYDWSITAERYYQNIYRPLLKSAALSIN